MAKKDPQQGYQFLAWATDRSELLVALLAPTDAAQIASPFVMFMFHDGDDVSSGNWEPHLTSLCSFQRYLNEDDDDDQPPPPPVTLLGATVTLSSQQRR
ncbi:hypothetical protein C8J56DRAFT_1054131 [Mycena floridula]|nr:hypothetical protein C8J56DRAFT_1054131 [Mycena floridula]